MIQAICINDKNKPEDFPSGKWVKKNNLYHITYVWWHPIQKVMGVSLKEINLDNVPKYDSFNISRFGIMKKDLEAFIELAKACTEMNDIDFNQMIEEVTTETKEVELLDHE